MLHTGCVRCGSKHAIHVCLILLFTQWEELSGLDVDSSTIRYYQVCNTDGPDQDNWARSQFIDAK